MPHSVDFHAAKIAPNVAFSDVMPGKSKTFSFVASHPVCSCTTAARRRRSFTSPTVCTGDRRRAEGDAAGAARIRVGRERVVPERVPATRRPLPRPDQGEQMTPDWVTWNGYAHQYKEHPLTASPATPSASGSSTPGRR
jgi:nitrite reductase (NO-forming)